MSSFISTFSSTASRSTIESDGICIRGDLKITFFKSHRLAHGVRFNLNKRNFSYQSWQEILDELHYYVANFNLTPKDQEAVASKLFSEILKRFRFHAGGFNTHKYFYVEIDLSELTRFLLAQYNFYFSENSLYKIKTVNKSIFKIDYKNTNIFNNLEIEDADLDLEVEVEETPFFEFGDFSPMERKRYFGIPSAEGIRLCASKRFNYGNVSYDVQQPFVEEIPQRNPELLARLRAILNVYHMARTAGSYFNKFLYYIGYKSAPKVAEMQVLYQKYKTYRGIDGDLIPVFEPEMEEPSAHGEGVLAQDQASNVILTEARVDSTEVTAPVNEVSWGSMCSSDIAPDYSKIVDRWIQIDTFEWSKDTPAGQFLKEYVLPNYIVKNEPVSSCHMANCVPFTIHRYWKGDLEIKIHINSNKFQLGSLQCSWLYYPDADDNLASRLNIFNLSQAHHVIINASASNEVTLTVPFKYFLPFLHTKPRADMSLPALNLGRLFIYVLNPLCVSTGGPTSAYVTVFAKTINNEFTGMLSGDIDALQPEMDNLLASAVDVAGTLCTTFMDRNRDNPPQPEPPRFLVPTASHSWAIGTGMSEPLHPLRLDGRGQVPHPPGIDVNNEMMVGSIVRRFGLLKTIEWSKDSPTNVPLWQCSAAPLMLRGDYISEQNTEDNSLSTYFVPPVGVVSSMFMGWRGTLEFRFDVIATQFHTGRLIIGYIPGAGVDTAVELKHIRASPNMVFNLQEAAQFTFKVPYIANKPVWPRMYAGDYDVQDAIAPSRLYIFILNKLIPMQSVVDKIFINIYVRAGEDFELLIPVQPALGLGYNNKYLINSEYPSSIEAQTGYSPYYSGAFEDFTTAQVFRWGTLSHQIAQFYGRNRLDGKKYSYSVIKNKDASLTVWDGSTNVIIKYAVFLYLDQLKYVVGIPCKDQRSAMLLARNLFILKLSLNDAKNNDYVFNKQLPTTSNGFCKGNPVWNIEWLDSVVTLIPQGERDEAGSVFSLGGVASSMSGMRLYGENFSDLKDLCRRYQLYGVYLIPDIGANSLEYVRVHVPLLPQGLTLNLGSKGNIFEAFNRGREGHIPLIASGFRYYRGGLRFRIVIIGNKKDVVFVQHRPDRILRSASITGDDNAITGESVVNHTYASYLQLTNINGVIEVEVPFYLLGMYGLLQTPRITPREESNFFSLGELVIGIAPSRQDAPNQKNTYVTVYYSIADDMTFSTFQGFPKMVFVSDIPTGNKKIAEADVDLTDMCIVEHEGLLDYLISKQEIKEKMSSVASEVVDDMIDHATESVKDRVSALTEEFTKVVGDFDKSYKDCYLKIGIELTHIICDPTLKTLIFCVVKILVEMKIVVCNSITSAIDVVTELLKRWGSRVSSEPIVETSDVSNFEPEGWFTNFNAKDWISLAGMIFTGVSAFTGLACRKPKDMSKLASLIVTEMPNSVKGGSFIITFLTSIVDLVKRIFKYVVSKVYPVESWYYDLEDQLPDVQDWINEVLYLDSKDLDSMLDMDGYFYDRIFAAFLFGQQLVSRYAEVKDSRLNAILRVQDKIAKKYDTMINLGKHPFIRKEPFCIWVEGKPGIGKSYVMEFLTTSMLKSVNYKLKGPKVFTVMPAGEFWTGCKNQPVLNVDDAFSVEMGTTLEKQLNLMYMVKSPVALNPPMAALEDKHLRYNPEIFYINSNKSFLNLAGLDPKAIHRRRDILIRAEVIDPARPEAYQYSSEELKNFAHLRFFVAESTIDPNTRYEGPYTYAQITSIICKKYKRFYFNESCNFKRRLETYEDLLDDEMTEDELDLQHVFTLKEQLYKKHGDCVLEYKQALDNCWYSKLNRWKHEISEKYFGVAWKTRFLGPLYRTMPKEEEAAPEGDIKFDVEDLNSFKIEEISSVQFPDDFFEGDDKFSIYKENSPYVVHTMMCLQAIIYIIKEKITVIPELDEQNLKDLSLGMCNIFVMTAKMILNNDLEYTQEFVDMLRLTFNLIAQAVGASTDLMTYNWDTILDATLNDTLKSMMALKVPSRVVDDILDKVFICLPEGFNLNMYDMPYTTLTFKVVLQLVVAGVSAAEVMKEQKDMFSTYGYEMYLRCLNSKFLPTSVLLSYGKLECQHIKREYKYVNDKFVSGKHELKDYEFCGDECILRSRILSFYWHMTIVRKDRRLRLLFNQRKMEMLPSFFRHSELALQLTEFNVKFYEGLIDEIKKWITDHIPVKVLTWLSFLSKVAIFAACLYAAFKGANYIADKYGLKEFLSRFVVGNWCTSIGWGTAMVASEAVPTAQSFAVAENSYKIPSKIFEHPVMKVNATVPQMAEDQAHIFRKIQRNSFMIVCEYVENGSLRILKARCLGIQGNRALCIRHYHDAFLAVPENAVFYYEKYENGPKGNRVEIKYRSLRTDAFILLDKNFSTNYFILYLPPQIALFKNIVSLVPYAKDHMYAGRAGCLYEYGKGINYGISFKQHGSFYINRRGSMEPVMVMSGYAYDYHGYGVCGSLLLSEALRQTPLIGMHVAGGESKGLAEPLYREMFEALRPQFVKDIEEADVVGEPSKAKVDLETTVLKLGVVEPEMIHVETGKTALRKSECFGVLPNAVEPNPLAANDPRLPADSSPMKKGCEKHGLPVKMFDPLRLAEAASHYESIVFSTVLPIRLSVGKMDLQDVVCGNPQIPGCESLEWNTSPGFGFTHIKNRPSGKKWLFELEECESGYRLLGLNPMLEKVLTYKQKLREEGIVPSTVFVDCLKDTTIPIEKCKVPGKTRIFSISPVDFTIQFKQYFGDFLCAYTQARFRAEHAIGINCDGLEWTDLAIIMQSKGSAIVDLDYSNYGPGLALDVAMEVFRIIINWYKYHGATDEYCNILWIFAHEIVCAQHLCFNLIYKVYSGIPSGSPITAPLNSMANSIYIRIVWGEIFQQDREFHSLESFINHVRIVTYGDDVIMNVSDAVKVNFNASTICRAFEKYGIVCTDARKTGNILPYTSLLECSFLSRQFVLHPYRSGKFLAALKKISIEGCANWVRVKNTDLRAASLVNSRMAVELAFGWGEEYYNSVYSKLRDFWASKNEIFIAKSWAERDREIFEFGMTSISIPIPYL